MHRKLQGAASTVTAAIAAVLAISMASLGGAPAPAHAQTADNAVLDWNRHALTALTNPTGGSPPGAGQTPPVAVVHLAMVQGAVYDAVNSIARGYTPYLGGLPSAPRTASQEAAAATATHHVLVGLTPVPLPAATTAWLDQRYSESLAAIDAGPTSDSDIEAGIAAGEAAAHAMLSEREDDGRYTPFSFTEGTAPGQWRPTATAPPFNDPFAWVAKVEPFMLESRSQFRTKGPHALGSGAYAKEYNEVKALGGGGATPHSRTPEQTALAVFYTVNPVEMFNRTFRTIAEQKGLTVAEEARLFAMLNVTGADSIINCWDDKEFWGFWRPLTAIRSGHEDGNHKTVGDSAWTPLVNNPPYPDHPSGYNCATSAFMHVGKAFFGNKTDFNVVRVAAGAPTVTRSYKRFTDVVKDTIDARIYAGIHFRAPDEQGAGIGKDVSHWQDKNFFQPVKQKQRK